MPSDEEIRTKQEKFIEKKIQQEMQRKRKKFEENTEWKTRYYIC